MAKTRDRHGNPRDLRAYRRRLLAPERDAWQLPDRVVRALGLAKGRTVAEIGAGPGYFTLRLARAVGPRGAVLAVEVEPQLAGELLRRLAKERVGNVTPVLALPGDPLLPRASCDLVLAVNVFHHFRDVAGYLRRLRRALRPGGRIAVVDFHRRELPVGPPLRHKLAREELLALARRAGLAPIAEPGFLPHQYFVILAPRR